MINDDDDNGFITNYHYSQPNQQAREVAPKLKPGALKMFVDNRDAKKMLIVRHPFDRSVFIVHRRD